MLISKASYVMRNGHSLTTNWFPKIEDKHVPFNNKHTKELAFNYIPLFIQGLRAYGGRKSALGRRKTAPKFNSLLKKSARHNN